MKHRKTSIFSLLIVIVLSTAFTPLPDRTTDLKKIPADVILEWNLIAYESMGSNYQHSLQAARLNAMVHLAMHDALNAIQPVYQTYALKAKNSKAHPVAAAATAAHTVLAGSFPEKKNELDARLLQTLRRISDGNAKQQGIRLGNLAGQTILDLRRNDGAGNDPIGKTQSAFAPGVYQFVPPFDFIFAPHWSTMQTFSLSRYDQFRSAPPPSIDSREYAKAFDEVKNFGSKNSNQRTSVQTFYAQFWYEFSEIGWNRVARTAVANKNLNLIDAARLMALVNMALADSYTAGWDSKFFYNHWRPYTAIRHAENDGNPQTAASADWEPLMPTPPVHDYPSTHSALGNAAATVLASLLGNETPFTMTSNTAQPSGSTRSFRSFHEAADENADSRVMAGIHFRFACEAGQTLGNKVGKWTVENHLRPR
jgi:hypothetical protein